jgi:hypothetical protein
MDAHGATQKTPLPFGTSPKPVRSQRPEYTFAANGVTAVGWLTLLHYAERGHAVRGA